MLRPYQQAAHDAAINWIKRSIEPAIIEAETGSGKSHVIAAIAKSFYELSGKHVLCTAPSAELVQQNTDKFLLTGEKASIFSASIGKSLRHPIVFGTPVSIKNSINKFSDKFGLVCIDEAHGITPTIKSIIDVMRDKNPMLRVLGLSATPYRLGTGLIYAIDENDKPSSPEECRDPYFKKKLFTIGGRELIEQGYLTQPIIGAIHGDHYDTLSMQLNSMGKFNANDIDRAYHGQGRKTSGIIADIVNQAKNRNGVMIFAATVKHAHECLESLPRELSAIVTGETPKHERANILARFKRRELKYLVNVSVLTTGFDAPHVDLIALLRATESIGLMKQIIGRGLRICKGKQDCLILDYAENIDRHCPDHDIFNPEIKAYNASTGGEQIKAICELCKTENTFTARKNEDNLKWDEHGYYVDLDGNRIESEYGALPAHYGRRCLGLHLQRNGKYEQCDYYWTFKECGECGEKCDIAARYCPNKHELINPNDKLIAEFRARKRDPYQLQCDKVLSWNQIKTLSQSGNEVLKIEYTTEYRSFTVWHQIKSGNAFFIKQYEKFLIATQGGDIMPESITYKKNAKTGFFEVMAYNQEVDKLEVA
mgnify:CR=1 FL=1